MGCMVPKYGISPCCGSLAVQRGWTDSKAEGMKKPNSAKCCARLLTPLFPYPSEKMFFKTFVLLTSCIDVVWTPAPQSLCHLFAVSQLGENCTERNKGKAVFCMTKQDISRKFQSRSFSIKSGKIVKYGKKEKYFFRYFFRHSSDIFHTYLLFIHTSDIFHRFSVKLKVLLYNANLQFFAKKCT